MRPGLPCRKPSARVQEMHRAIAGKSFDVLTGIPLIAGPAAFAKVMHDAISEASTRQSITVLQGLWRKRGHRASVA